MPDALIDQELLELLQAMTPEERERIDRLMVEAEVALALVERATAVLH